MTRSPSERQGELLEAALAYIGRGLQVVPLHSPRDGGCSCGRGDCPSPAKHPRTRMGLRDATADQSAVMAWWGRWPDANVGVVTGVASGVVVLDVDTQHGGLGTLRALEREHGALPSVPQVLTGGGGYHYYFKRPAGEVRNSAGKLGHGLDVRGDGGYVVAPPSVHASGRPYRWTKLGDGAELVEPPAWLLADAEKRRNGHAEPVDDVIPEGKRREALLSLAGTMRRRGMRGDEVLAALTAVNASRCRPPLPSGELEALAGDVAERYAPDPASALPSASSAEDLPDLRVVPLDEFASVDEPSAEPLLGDSTDTILSAGGGMVLYGDGGAGKTTLELDLVFHLAAGEPWLHLPVPRPCRVLVVENEGPRGKFRIKLRDKIADWTGPAIGERIYVLEEPWALFTFASDAHRAALRSVIEEHEIDVIAAGPVQRLGIRGGGTPEEVSAFVFNVELVRADLERPVAVVFAHHENKAGDVSGAWEGVPDTLAHVQARGNGATRLFWQKVRWGSTLHGKGWTLLWRPGESFELDDAPELSDDDIAAAVLTAVRENPGASWNLVDGQVKGKNARRREVRDQLLETERLVNVGGDHRFVLYVADDPLLEQVRPARGAPGAQLGIGTASPDESASAPHASPIGGGGGAGALPGKPDNREADA